jgi:hypothetical protein
MLLLAMKDSIPNDRDDASLHVLQAVPVMPPLLPNSHPVKLDAGTDQHTLMPLREAHLVPTGE